MNNCARGVERVKSSFWFRFPFPNLRNDQVMKSLFLPWLIFALVAFAGLMPLEAGAAPLVLSTPGGLSTGDHFRFIFVTGSTATATSSDINSYDSFVRTDVSSLYGTVTYMGSSITNWQAVVSTPTVSAKDHLGGYSSSVSAFLPTGTKVATSLTTSTGGLWSGIFYGSNSLSMYLDGTSTPYTNIWTGSANDGTVGLLPMGSSNVTVGHTYVGGNWLYTNPPGSAVASTAYRLFAVSPELIAGVGPVTPVPEIDPATGSSALSLVAGVLAMIEQRRRRAALVA